MGTVLIVDDDADSREVLSTMLTEPGRFVETAGTVQDAFRRARNDPRPAVILLDYCMPEMFGEEFLERKHEDPLIASIPAIVVSGLPKVELPRYASDFLSKPVDPARLTALVRQYC